MDVDESRLAAGVDMIVDDKNRRTWTGQISKIYARHAVVCDGMVLLMPPPLREDQGSVVKKMSMDCPRRTNSKIKMWGVLKVALFPTRRRRRRTRRVKIGQGKHDEGRRWKLNFPERDSAESGSSTGGPTR